jgi:excisionase family DNA binding protein
MATKNEQNEGTGIEPLVKSADVARVLNVTQRYVGILTTENRIPAHKFGRRCIRYRLSDVLSALGVSPA